MSNLHAALLNITATSNTVDGSEIRLTTWDV